MSGLSSLGLAPILLLVVVVGVWSLDRLVGALDRREARAADTTSATGDAVRSPVPTTTADVRPAMPRTGGVTASAGHAFDRELERDAA